MYLALDLQYYNSFSSLLDNLYQNRSTLYKLQLFTTPFLSIIRIAEWVSWKLKVPPHEFYSRE
jgi:hypothetical protein